MSYIIRHTLSTSCWDWESLSKSRLQLPHGVHVEWFGRYDLNRALPLSPIEGQWGGVGLLLQRINILCNLMRHQLSIFSLSSYVNVRSVSHDVYNILAHAREVESPSNPPRTNTDTRRETLACEWTSLMDKVLHCKPAPPPLNMITT